MWGGGLQRSCGEIALTAVLLLFNYQLWQGPRPRQRGGGGEEGGGGRGVCGGDNEYRAAIRTVTGLQLGRGGAAGVVMKHGGAEDKRKAAFPPPPLSSPSRLFSSSPVCLCVCGGFLLLFFFLSCSLCSPHTHLPSQLGHAHAHTHTRVEKGCSAGTRRWQINSVCVYRVGRL